MGHGCGQATAALAAKAKLNVASQAGLAVDGCTTAHTKGGGGQVGRHHVLHLAEGTAGGHHGAAHVTQDGLARGGQGGGEVPDAAGHAAGSRHVAPARSGEAATQGASVGAGRVGLSTLVDLATQIADVDVVADVIHIHLLVSQERGHLLYRWIRNNFWREPELSGSFRIECPR